MESQLELADSSGDETVGDRSFTRNASLGDGVRSAPNERSGFCSAYLALVGLDAGLSLTERFGFPFGQLSYYVTLVAALASLPVFLLAVSDRLRPRLAFLFPSAMELVLFGWIPVLHLILGRDVWGELWFAISFWIVYTALLAVASAALVTYGRATKVVDPGPAGVLARLAILSPVLYLGGIYLARVIIHWPTTYGLARSYAASPRVPWRLGDGLSMSLMMAVVSGALCSLALFSAVKGKHQVLALIGLAANVAIFLLVVVISLLVRY